MVVSHQIRVLGSEHGSSGRAANECSSPETFLQLPEYIVSPPLPPVFFSFLFEAQGRFIRVQKEYLKVAKL